MPDKLLFLTSVPSFYKNLLFNSLAAKAEVSVFFTNHSEFKRENDFFRYQDHSLTIPKKQALLSNLISLYKASKTADRIYYGAWDGWYYWLMICLTPKRKNHVMVESSIYEFSNAGIKKKLLNVAKRLFLYRNRVAIVCGEPHEQLVKQLHFKGTIIKSYSVGLLDFKYPPVKRPVATRSVTNFLYVGRLSKAKGIDLLIAVFKTLPHLHLHLVGQLGDAWDEGDIQNITWHGYKSRDELKAFFSVCDVFVLPSLFETWGLVVEEALYHGLPVAVSNKVGCNKDLVESLHTGLVFNVSDFQSLSATIVQMTDLNFYNQLLQNVNAIDFEAKKLRYTNSFRN